MHQPDTHPFNFIRSVGWVSIDSSEVFGIITRLTYCCNHPTGKYNYHG